MELKDLRTGMLIQLENKLLYLILLGTKFGNIAVANNNPSKQILMISSFNADLTHVLVQYSVVKVYEPSSPMGLFTDDVSNLNLLFSK